jgi:hypothetical protein
VKIVKIISWDRTLAFRGPTILFRHSGTSGHWDADVISRIGFPPNEAGPAGFRMIKARIFTGGLGARRGGHANVVAGKCFAPDVTWCASLFGVLRVQTILFCHSGTSGHWDADVISRTGFPPDKAGPARFRMIGARIFTGGLGARPGRDADVIARKRFPPDISLVARIRCISGKATDQSQGANDTN